MTGCKDVGPWAGRPRAQMVKSDEVEAMLHLRALGWGLRRIARELGCSKNTVKRYVAADGWMTYSRQTGGGKLEDQEAWLKERFFQHRGNAEVVRQDLVREQGIDVSLRTVERAVAPFRRLLTAEAKATVRFETPPGRQLQVDFGQLRVPIADERVRVFLFVATLGYSRRCYVATFRHERQSSWFHGLEGAFHHFGGVTREVLIDYVPRHIIDHDAVHEAPEVAERRLDAVEQRLEPLDRVRLGEVRVGERQRRHQVLHLARHVGDVDPRLAEVDNRSFHKGLETSRTGQPNLLVRRDATHRRVSSPCAAPGRRSPQGSKLRTSVRVDARGGRKRPRHGDLDACRLHDGHPP